jgi:hypothetical protein
MIDVADVMVTFLDKSFNKFFVNELMDWNIAQEMRRLLVCKLINFGH